MKILVLGSEGQIGKPFCSFADGRGHEIIRIDKKISEFQNLANDSLDYSMSSKFHNCDIVLFLAFEVGGSKFLLEKDKTYEYIAENVKMLSNVFGALWNTKKPFLFASSQMANMHHTNYGFLKDLGERYTRALEGYICRFWNVYGYEDPLDPKSHVITDFIHAAKTTGSIKMRTTGKEERQFLHTDDCSTALMHWCENYKEYDKDEYLDITSFKWNSILDIANIISKKLNVGVEVGESIDKIQNGIKNIPSTYIRKFWNPKISLEDGIGKLI